MVALAATGCGPKPVFRTTPLPPLGTEATKDTSSHRAPGKASTERTGEVEALADPWLGVPYRYGGISRRGIDCSGLALSILGELGVTLPRTVAEQRKMGREVGLEEVSPGDLLFFRMRSARVDHVGVALDRTRFVHASVSRGVVVDHLMSEYYSNRVAGARRVRVSPTGRRREP
jgi:cell wall-associated NlpC family hydrolase